MSHLTTPKNNKDSKTKTKNHSQDSIPSFIRKTYDILEECKFPEIIDWNPEGTALVIKKPSEFCQKVLPAYFKHNNLTSFVRQLNMYNFHKRRTQNIDHVYYHELFQKGKKHLLKEIKRKNHEHNLEKNPKLPEIAEPQTTGKDMNSLIYENQLLKRLYNDAVSRISHLEAQFKEVSGHNQTLWSQVQGRGDNNNNNNNNKEVSLKPMFKLESKSDLTQDQLPMTFGEVVIPPLKLAAMQRQSSLMMAKFPSMGVNCFLNFSKPENVESTEASHSPSLQPSLESDKNFDMTEEHPFSEVPSGRAIQLPTITLNPNATFFQAFKPSELMVSNKEMSIGQLFENWNSEQPELFTFADQKNDRALQDATNTTSVLGKRALENIDSAGFQVPEPSMKRELSLFFRRSLFSNGTDDGMLKGDFDANNGVEISDFNHPFLNWTKAT